MKTGKKVLGAVLAAAMALSSITPVFAADKVKITFMSRDSGDTPIAKVYEDQIAAFMEENPDVENDAADADVSIPNMEELQISEKNIQEQIDNNDEKQRNLRQERYSIRRLFENIPLF